MVQYRVENDCANINWDEVCCLLKEAGLATRTAALIKKAFTSSYCVAFVFDNAMLVGVGRAVSDGAYQAAIYDIAVLPSYQGRQLGKLIVEELHKTLRGFNVILYASPGKEEFYCKLGYRKMITGMAKFNNESVMREKGFIE